MAYDYDVFISYSHRGSVVQWLRNHFHPTLMDCLADTMPRDPQVFVDFEQETGVHWPHNLTQALLRSRYLLAILSPPYFRSPWCLAEWHTMRERERLTGLRSASNPRGLIHAVSYADGEHFSDDARLTQWHEMNRWAIPVPVFRETREFVIFYQEMRKLAADLAKQIERAPDWQSEWPVIRPEPEPALVASLPRL
ncbi:MAG TPA: toll/interleukin-1 receptor domain-containing protein [Thermoanaerobaculia bacterium]|nr:toll/interleukin-1 receptor domain-containing protein [Thermoanaerobaculia bacterium]